MEPLESGLGRCSKEECQMLQKYDVCPEQSFAKLMFKSGLRLLSLNVHGKTLKELAGVKDSEVTEAKLLQVSSFISIILLITTVKM